MKRVALQILLGIGGLLMFFRFGGPALVFGATGPGPFGNPWLTQGKTATLLLDADLRFFGAMMIGTGVVLFRAIYRIQTLASVVYILAGAIAVGAAARIYARLVYGDPGTAGTIPIVLETTLPVLIVLLQYSIVKDSKDPTK
jgi:hypothetical protein